MIQQHLGYTRALSKHCGGKKYSPFTHSNSEVSLMTLDKAVLHNENFVSTCVEDQTSYLQKQMKICRKKKVERFCSR